MVATMVLTRLLGILACLIAAVLISPWPLKGATVTQQVAEVSSAPIAITDVTVDRRDHWGTSNQPNGADSKWPD
jgi:hypothetical protein